MELIPSVSRSSDLQKDGSELKKDSVQKDYWKFLQTKLTGYFKKYPILSHISRSSTESQRNAQSNILILFRKLREGVMAARRYDDFALEVYETSFYLSVIFRLNAQTVSIGSLLVPHGGGQKCFYEIYEEPFSSNLMDTESKSPIKCQSEHPDRQIYHPPGVRRTGVSNTNSKQKPTSKNLDSSIASTSLLYLLNALTSFYPFQAPFHTELRNIRRSQWGCNKDAQDMLRIFTWTQSIASALLMLNYIRLGKLTQLAALEALPGFSEMQIGRGKAETFELRLIALQCLLEDIRHKVQQTTWQSLKSAYRELDTGFSAEWIQRALLLRVDSGSVSTNVEKWLSERGEAEVQKKAGVEGCWILRR